MSPRSPHGLLLLTAACATLGCGPPVFHVTGTLVSAGATRRNTWNSAPQGCSRDPLDALPADKSATILAFQWEEPGMRDPKVGNWTLAPDAPMLLEFSKGAPGEPAIRATLHTRYQAGIPLSKDNCASFSLVTSRHPPQPPETRPSLAGDVILDCRLADTRITANLRFDHCEY